MDDKPWTTNHGRQTMDDKPWTTNHGRQTMDDKPVVQPEAAGVDIGAREIFAAVPNDPEGRPVRRFEVFTADLENMACWMKACGVTTGCHGVDRRLLDTAVRGSGKIWSEAVRRESAPHA
jgi:hypothetical protein